MTASSSSSSFSSSAEPLRASDSATDNAVPGFVLRGDYIELDKLLKVVGWADSGGAARHLIADGQVQVNGEVELRKTAKIRAGQIVSFQDQRIKVEAAA